MRATGLLTELSLAPLDAVETAQLARAISGRPLAAADTIDPGALRQGQVGDAFRAAFQAVDFAQILAHDGTDFQMFTLVNFLLTFDQH
mgnify:CR=1 FL=1